MMNDKKKGVTRVLSADLSMKRPGLAVMDIVNGQVLIKEVIHVDNSSAKLTNKHGARLNRTAAALLDICERYPDIDVIVRERGFSGGANPNVTQILFRVVGVFDYMIYRLWDKAIDDKTELAPTAVKRLVAQDGKADKSEVEAGVRGFLVPEQKEIIFKCDDESDAVAVGIAWAIKAGLLK